jgi:hypothetical protein
MVTLLSDLPSLDQLIIAQSKRNLDIKAEMAISAVYDTGILGIFHADITLAAWSSSFIDTLLWRGKVIHFQLQAQKPPPTFQKMCQLEVYDTYYSRVFLIKAPLCIYQRCTRSRMAMWVL